MSISVQIEPRLEHKLNEYCRIRHTSQAAVLQRALEAFLDDFPEPQTNPRLDHPFIGGEPGTDPEAARQSQQRLRSLMAGKAGGGT